MRRIGTLLFGLLFAGLFFLLLGQLRQTAVYQPAGNTLLELVYLGRGGNYTNDPGFNFIVKRLNPFRFVFQPGPTYSAGPNEDVWRSFNTGGDPPALFEEDVLLANVTAGCVVRYIAIDDQEDGRRNRFLLDDVELIHLMPEGMVVEGEFVIPRDAGLYYDARDSVAVYIDICGTFFGDPTATATSTPEDTATPTATATMTNTAVSTATATTTILPTETATVTGTAFITTTPISTPTITPTSSEATTTPEPEPIQETVVPTQTPTPSLSATPTRTRRPTRTPVRGCLRINFEVSGDVAREGTFVVRETGGSTLFTWPAQDGWQDSGWQYGIKLSHDSVYVDVFYVAPDGSETKMVIWNPAPGTSHGWLTRGVCHALEVGWP